MIIQQLKEIQTRDRLTDSHFAGRLGIHHMSWSRLKNGRGGVMDIKTIQKAIHAYPEIIESVLQELYGDDYLEVVWPLFKEIISGQIREKKAQMAVKKWK